jgi:hypothetical protein
MPTIENLNYYRAITAGTFNVNPIDFNGNILTNITIDCDATLGDVIIELPNISVFGGRYECKITVNRLDNSLNGVRVVADTVTPGNLIGSLTEVGLPTRYDSVTCQPVSANGWSASTSLSNLPNSVGALSQATLALAQYVDAVLGTTLCVIDYNATGDGCAIVKNSTTNGDYQDWIVLATENAASTGHIGDNPA